MRRRILLAIGTVATVAVVLFGVPLALIAVRFVDEDASLRVEREAVLAARAVPADFASRRDPVELPQTGDGIVLALYDVDGVLVSGSGPRSADPTTVASLANRVVATAGSGRRVVAVPVAADERVIGVIRAEQPTAAADHRSRWILAVLAGLAVAVLAIGAAIGYVLAGRLTRPVRRLRDAAVRLGEGDFAIEMPRSRVPELDQAAQAMTVTARRLDDLLARERSFGADASHQLRTPLTGLRTAIETELALPRDDPSQVLREAMVDIERLERTITDLISITRSRGTPQGPVSLADVLDDVETAWRRRFAAAGRPLVVASTRYAPAIEGSAALLRHALDVLIDNALRHGSGIVRVDHTVTDETVTLRIGDEGEGFAHPLDATAAARPRGVTGDGDGHGLGLPLARRLVEQMPGRLTLARTGPHPQVDLVLQRADFLPSAGLH